jgi:hypothetical protein
VNTLFLRILGKPSARPAKREPDITKADRGQVRGYLGLISDRDRPSSGEKVGEEMIGI